MKKGILVAVTILLGTTAGWAQEQTPAQKAEVESAKVRLAMMEVNRRLADSLSAGRAEQIADCFTEDAALLPPGASPVGGRPAVVAYFKQLIESGKLTVQVKSTLGSFAGALGYDAGRYSLVIDPKQGSQSRDVGKFVTILRKGADGNWRISLDIWNSDATAQ
jgi:uncharacterized protein (TIGR02246 family)